MENNISFNNPVGFDKYHTHNSIDGTPLLDESLSIINTRRYVVCRIVGATTDTSVSNVVGGDFVMPFGGYVSEINATVDTAGTTGTTTIDINKNGATIMTTKVTIDSTEKTSRTATTPSIIDPTKKNFVLGDIFTFDVDAINTTAAKGLTIYMNVVKTS